MGRDTFYFVQIIEANFEKKIIWVKTLNCWIIYFLFSIAVKFMNNSTFIETVKYGAFQQTKNVLQLWNQINVRLT